MSVEAKLPGKVLNFKTKLCTKSGMKRSQTFKHRQVMDLDVMDLGFSGPRIPFSATRCSVGTRHAFFSITFLSI